MTSRDAWLMLQLVIGLGTELYTARVVVRRYQLYYSCEVRSCTIWLYYLFYCRLVAMPTSQYTLHCPCTEKNSWFVIVVCLCKYLVICHLCLLQHRSMVPDHVLRAWGGVEPSLLHPLKVLDQISQPSCCLTTWNRTSTSCLIVSAS